MYVPLQVNRFKKFILLIVQYKYLKSFSRRFYCPNLILRTRLCGTMFITQQSCLFDLDLTESVKSKWFVLVVYQFRKGISAGPALKYFTLFIGAGGGCLIINFSIKQLEMAAAAGSHSHRAKPKSSGTSALSTWRYDDHVRSLGLSEATPHCVCISIEC